MFNQWLHSGTGSWLEDLRIMFTMSLCFYEKTSCPLPSLSMVPKKCFQTTVAEENVREKSQNTKMRGSFAATAKLP